MEDNRSGYVICSNPRSGSTYLVALLESTGVLGRPYEWMRGDGGVADPSTTTYDQNEETQLRIVLTAGSSPNGVYGLKIFPEHFDLRTQSRWAERFPNLKYIFLRRDDIVDQAISLTIARQTGSYASWMPLESEPVYSFEHLMRSLNFLVVGEARWRLFFALNNLRPLAMSYDELVAAPQQSVNRVATLLGVETALIGVGRLNPQVQRSTVTDDWKRRFMHEAAELGRLPQLDGSTAA